MASMGRLALNLTRRFSTTAVRRDIQQEGMPGANLPFDIHNRYKLAGLFVVFFGTGLTAPFLLVRHQILKD